MYNALVSFNGVSKFWSTFKSDGDIKIWLRVVVGV